MTIKVNGQNRDVPEGTNILVLLEGFKLAPDKVAVEVNRRLVRTAQYANALKAGDEIEIVTFVGGG
ncbi:MAG: sulfur carrier protein ThiS [Bacillota bacterium]